MKKTTLALLFLFAAVGVVNTARSLVPDAHAADTVPFFTRRGGAGGCTDGCTFTGTTTATTLTVSGTAKILAVDAGTLTLGTGSSSVPQVKCGGGGDCFFSAGGANDIVAQLQDGTETGRFSNSDGVKGAPGVTGNSWLAVVNNRPLPTCSSGTYGRIYMDNTGQTGGKWSKLCVCTGDGTSFKWLNVIQPTSGGSQTGTTTTCQDS